MPKSTYSANNYINSAYRGQSFSAPSTIYVALYTAMPGVGGGGTEVSGGSYVRQAVTFAVPSGGVSSNSTAVTYPIATGVWGTILGYGYLDAAVNGNLLSFMTLSASRTIGVGDQVIFDVGNLTLAET